MTSTRLILLALACAWPMLVGSDRSASAIYGRDSTHFTSAAAVRHDSPQTRSYPDARNAEPTVAPLYELNWVSVNSGGEARLQGAAFDLGITTGEAVAGFVTGTRFDMGFGFWYGSGLCPIATSGDVNLNGQLSTSDIITMVNYALKAGPEPLPCVANGDVNCSGNISLADIIVLINFVLKAGPPPCNVCDIIPSRWTCL